MIMEKIITQYQKRLQELENFKQKVMEETAIIIEHVFDEPFVIGNMTYYYGIDQNGNYYVAYLDSVSGEFKPIYDKEQTFDYGWADFEQVARILDVINNRLETIKNNN